MKSLLYLFLALLAWVLFIPFWVISFIFLVFYKGYKVFDITFSMAENIDRFANYEFRTFWNATLVKNNAYAYYAFGNFGDTLSYALAVNKQLGVLSKAGILLCKLLDFLDKNHIDKQLE